MHNGSVYSSVGENLPLKSKVIIYTLRKGGQGIKPPSLSDLIPPLNMMIIYQRVPNF